MKRTIALATPCLNMLGQYRRCMYTALVLLFMLVTSVSLVNAQSKDRGEPTLLTSNQISGRIEPDNAGDVYYYSLMAGPGELTVTLSLEATRQSVVSLRFDLSRGSRIISSGDAMAHRAKPTAERKIHVNLTQRESLLLTIRFDSGSPGKYSFEFGGALDVGSNKPAKQDNDTDIFAFLMKDADNPECLPKKGILRVKMKDGSVRRIDLSKAEEIAIEP